MSNIKFRRNVISFLGCWFELIVKKRKGNVRKERKMKPNGKTIFPREKNEIGSSIPFHNPLFFSLSFLSAFGHRNENK